MERKQMVYEKLAKMGLPFEAVEHEAVFTVEEMHRLAFPPGVTEAKNLFLRDAKGKRHFLITAGADRAVNLKALEGILGSTKLSFASEERLDRYLGLTKGSVTPLGLLNDTEGAVEFYLDEALRDCEKIGVHPNDNTATVFLSWENLLAFVEKTGHEVHLVRL